MHKFVVVGQEGGEATSKAKQVNMKRSEANKLLPTVLVKKLQRKRGRGRLEELYAVSGVCVGGLIVLLFQRGVGVKTEKGSSTEYWYCHVCDFYVFPLSLSCSPPSLIFLSHHLDIYLIRYNASTGLERERERGGGKDWGLLRRGELGIVLRAGGRDALNAYHLFSSYGESCHRLEPCTPDHLGPA